MHPTADTTVLMFLQGLGAAGDAGRYAASLVLSNSNGGGSSMYLIILIALAIGASVLMAYTGKVQATTLWAGKMLAGREFEAQMPRGFQDAITPKSQNRRNTLMFILLIVILIFGSFIKWYAGILGVIAAALLSGIVGRFISDDLEYYLLRLIAAMDNREADYRKNNDIMRADAAHDMAKQLKNLLMLIHGQGMKVPQMKEIKNM